MLLFKVLQLMLSKNSGLHAGHQLFQHLHEETLLLASQAIGPKELPDESHQMAESQNYGNVSTKQFLGIVTVEARFLKRIQTNRTAFPFPDNENA